MTPVSAFYEWTLRNEWSGGHLVKFDATLDLDSRQIVGLF